MTFAQIILIDIKKAVQIKKQHNIFVVLLLLRYVLQLNRDYDLTVVNTPRYIQRGLETLYSKRF